MIDYLKEVGVQWDEERESDVGFGSAVLEEIKNGLVRDSEETSASGSTLFSPAEDMELSTNTKRTCRSPVQLALLSA